MSGSYEYDDSADLRDSYREMSKQQCAVCGENVTVLDIEYGKAAEMFDPDDETFNRSGVVHAECGVSAGWEIA